ncbi:MAG: Gfo/Idh/MocA family oxidoreductase [Planctomycetes bacterium]|nr:Gfo/Idh/MocA family oxidoreductase [Planctomycetota bacterium]
MATTRRNFLKSTAGLVGGAATAISALPAACVYAAGDDVLKVGLVGCGGRGTGAASQALRADPHVRLTAMADAFSDHLESSLVELKKETDLLDKIDVPPERRFVGFEAYADLLKSGVDVVLLATPPHFRPQHLAAAIAAGKHVFAEKPVAVDAPGVRSVLATCERARQQNLSVVSGLCLRYSHGFRESVARVHTGDIGEVRWLAANDYRGPVWTKKRLPDWSDMEWQMRNWYYYTWLSGDFNVEQHVHFLDVCTWLMGNEYPVHCVGTGGRQARTGSEFGHIYDHFSVVYEYASGTRLASQCRQIPGCSNNLSVQAIGTKGVADLSEKRFEIRGEKPWVRPGKDNNFYQTEHDELFASIRQGTPINNGDYMARSTLLAIMGRMAAYTGRKITWEMALNSKEDLSPPHYDWMPLPEPAVAIPGITPFA